MAVSFPNCRDTETAGPDALRGPDFPFNFLSLADRDALQFDLCQRHWGRWRGRIVPLNWRWRGASHHC